MSCLVLKHILSTLVPRVTVFTWLRGLTLYLRYFLLLICSDLHHLSLKLIFFPRCQEMQSRGSLLSERTRRGGGKKGRIKVWQSLSLKRNQWCVTVRRQQHGDKKRTEWFFERKNVRAPPRSDMLTLSTTWCFTWLFVQLFDFWQALEMCVCVHAPACMCIGELGHVTV